MSDVPPPPPPPGMMPPPPPAMTPPPGYAGYTPSNWQGGLGRVRSLGTWISVLLAFVAVGSIVSLATIGPLIDKSEKLLAGGSETDFDTAVGLNLVGSAVGSLATVAIVVLSIIWLFRIAQNHQRLGRKLRWAPGWAIGGWFAPPCLYVIPTLMLQESWKASDPTSPPGTDTWKRTRSSAAIWIWFAVYSVAGNVGAIAVNAGTTFDTDKIAKAQFFVDRELWLYAQPVLAVAGCVAWFIVVRSLSARHAQLTGEATAR